MLALGDCAAPPRALLQFVARKCIRDLGIIKDVSPIRLLTELKTLLADAEVGQDAGAAIVHQLHGVLEVAEWVARSDADAGGGNGWLTAYLDTLLDHNVTNIAQAKRLVEDYGDLREWKVPKVAARSLFASLEEISLRHL